MPDVNYPHDWPRRKPFTEIQTRSEESGIRFFGSIEDALNYAKLDMTVWKISYQGIPLRHKFVRSGNTTNFMESAK
jgi:hypothetical protein